MQAFAFRFSDPYWLAHFISLLIMLIVSIYFVVDLVRRREKGGIVNVFPFITFALAELSLLYYYEVNKEPFKVLAGTFIEPTSWFITFFFLILASASIAVIPLYLFEFRSVYFVPFAIVGAVALIMLYSYELFGLLFFVYLETTAVVRWTLAIGLGVVFLIALIGEVLLAIIYKRTRSLRALTLLITTALLGFINLGFDYLVSVLPMAFLAKPYREIHKLYYRLLLDWPINAVYILVTLVFLLGQLRILELLGSVRRIRESEKAWISEVIEGALKE